MYTRVVLAASTQFSLEGNFSPGACVMPWEFPEEGKPLV